MSNRRTFLKLGSAAVPSAVAIASTGMLRADDEKGNHVVGSWASVHTLPFPPGSFREFLSFVEGGVMNETNSFLYTSSSVDFSMFGLPDVVSAADGVGAWEHSPNGAIQVVFRKMLFDGSRQNFGDLHVTGSIRTDGAKLAATWHIEVLNSSDQVIADFGQATSQGVRLY